MIWYTERKRYDMAGIHILDSETIDKIAAGEVVERPSSVVKELVENAVDAGADAVTVEIKGGGIELIRVTDNGCGMEQGQLRTAFLRHATSKIETVEDLSRISSLGFRGEALSSIAAVARVEVVTRTAASLAGSRIFLEGAREVEFGEVGAPEGTTFLVRNLFFNTPVRRKFLKQPATEGGYIADLMEHLALSRPDISFKLVIGNQLRFHTSGNGDLREVIYRIYGKEAAEALVPIQAEKAGIRVEGYLGKPVQVRANRNFEIYFINGRFIRSNIVARALEEGYREYLMQHKFPMCVLHITMDAETVDVNVHPTKMDVRFSDGPGVSEFLTSAVKQTLQQREMMPEAFLSGDRERKTEEREERRLREKEHTPEPFEQKRIQEYRVMEESRYQADHPRKQDFLHNPVWARVKGTEDAEAAGDCTLGESGRISESQPEPQPEPETDGEDPAAEEFVFTETSEFSQEIRENDSISEGAAEPEMPEALPVQLNLFEEKILTEDNRARFRIVGQVFETYWLVQFEDKLLMIDQHAAHEKVNYERLMTQYREKKVLSQSLLPPVIVSLSGREESVLREHESVFRALGFEVEDFGGSEYALRSVPVDLYGCNEREMFLEVLDQLAEGSGFGGIRAAEEKIASMSCKAAVKGNRCLKMAEAEALIDELLTLDNPYNCPHGRPTIVTMTKAEMDRKFKRIVN